MSNWVWAACNFKFCIPFKKKLLSFPTDTEGDPGGDTQQRRATHSKLCMINKVEIPTSPRPVDLQNLFSELITVQFEKFTWCHRKQFLNRYCFSLSQLFAKLRYRFWKEPYSTTRTCILTVAVSEIVVQGRTNIRQLVSQSTIAKWEIWFRENHGDFTDSSLRFDSRALIFVRSLVCP